jgi:hypothetical protein
MIGIPLRRPQALQDLQQHYSPASRNLRLPSRDPAGRPRCAHQRGSHIRSAPSTPAGTTGSPAMLATAPGHPVGLL